MSLFCRLSFVLPLQLGPGPQLVADVQFPGHTEGPRWNSPWMQPAYVSDEDILPARQQSPAPLEVCFVSVLLFTQRCQAFCKGSCLEPHQLLPRDASALHGTQTAFMDTTQPP